MEKLRKITQCKLFLMKPVNIWKEQVFILEPSGDEFMKVSVEEGTRQQFFLHLQTNKVLLYIPAQYSFL